MIVSELKYVLYLFVVYIVFISNVAYSFESNDFENDSLEGKVGKELPDDMLVQGEGLIGNDTRLIIQIVMKDEIYYVVLKTWEKDKTSYITDIFKQPVLKDSESFLYASCSTKPDLSIIDAVAIVDYDSTKLNLDPKASWLIDYKNKKFIKNSKTKIFCVNESFGE